jgi:Fe-S cluster biogenesis protein NfuA/nitrite reductase/ring-hydroxylating ferredoxin subunit
MAERDPGSTMDRVTQLLREIRVAPTVERAQERSEELVRALVAFYGDGLERVLDIVHESAGERSEAIFAALCRDAFVESLLALHGLHPLSLEDRVQAALDSIRPYLESHEGSVELVGVDGGVAYVRLAGSCEGCQSSAATLKNAVEAAILEHVGEIVEVRAQGVEIAPAAAPSLKLQSDWVALDALPELARQGLAHVSCAGTPVLLVGRERTVFAYRDRCPVCTRALDGARLEWPFVRCAACGERFDVVHAGRVVENEALSAEPFPLVREAQRVRVAIPLGV